MLHIKKILNRNIAAAGLTRGVESSNIVEQGSEIIAALFDGPIAAKIHVSHVKDKTLFITCDSAPVAQELSFYTRQIQDQLDTVLGKGKITRITTNIG